MATPSVADVLAEIPRALEECARVALCQIVRVQGSTPARAGWKMLVRPGGATFGNLGGGAFEAMVRRDACDLLESAGASRVERYYLTEEAVKGQPTGMVCGGMIEVLLELLTAKPLLAICGGGPVGQALARQAAFCDFEVAVADDREDFRRPELFPPGTHCLAVSRDYAGDFLAGWRHRELYVAVVSRCWETDLAATAAVLRSRPEGLRYLGLMGSQRKVARVTSELAALSLDVATAPWRAPIGLAIGGATPAEIAVSIVAELIRERSGAEAGEAAPRGAVRLA
ncbi:MAG: XdhC/CoxI family protein [Acidobacteriota bacterium]|nr:XdhC/CoxI family protein [Acidobacteriota bacterium]MDH3524758.1 XdhC/CoxI family protein [Acidobacteriota bacterium]